MKHQSGPEEAPPPPSPVAGWASGFFRAILSILATAEEDYAEADVTVHAAPGLATLLDIAMYRSREAELTSVTCSANSLLAALFDLKRLAGSMLSEARAAGGGEHARAFASACLEQADEAIDRLTMEGLAGTANLDPAGPGGAGADRHDASGGGGAEAGGGRASLRRSKGGRGGGGGGGRGGPSADIGQLVTSYVDADAGSGGSRSLKPLRRDCWEAQRLYCPDYCWADHVLSFVHRLVRNLAKHRFVAGYDGGPGAPGGGGGGGGRPQRLPGSVAAAADAVLLLLRHDLPSRLHQFRAGIECSATIMKRLYLVKCEYRAPFRAFLEAHQSVQRAPSVGTVEACLQLHRRGDVAGLKKSKADSDRAVQEALRRPKLLEALELERRIEEAEVGMARMLIHVAELARFVDQRKARLRAISGVVEDKDVPVLEEMLRRFCSILRRKPGSELRTGFRRLLLDLQGVPRDTDLSGTDIFPFGSFFDESGEEATRMRFDVLLAHLRTLGKICVTKGGISVDKGGTLDVPRSIVQGLASLDEELLRAQHDDWYEMVTEQRKLEEAEGPSFAELSERVQRAEMDAGVAVAPKSQLEVLHERLKLMEEDREKRFEVLEEIVVELALREMNFVLDLKMPPKEAVLELPEMSALGLFGLQLQIADEPLPLG